MFVVFASPRTTEIGSNLAHHTRRDIFEHIVLPNKRLTPEQVQVFINLSRVCRLFADFCLSRIFELVEFSGSIFRDITPASLRNDAAYKASRKGALCTQVATKEPFARALAKTVRVCHFVHWKLDKTGSQGVR